MSDGIVIRDARPDDLAAIVGVLTACQLPAADLTAESIANFHLAEAEDGQIVGVAGLDRAGSRGLLRSVAVAPHCRGKGLGEELVRRCETAALVAGVTEAYLLTTTASEFFRRLGYQEISRGVVPAEIAAHAQFRSICPATADCLGKKL